LSRLLVFGGAGFVGERLACRALQSGWEVFAADINCQSSVEGIECYQVEITDRAGIERVIKRTTPTLVVNTAALADIDRAEQEKELAWRINVTGAENVAGSCASIGARHVFFSSDAVFDGEVGPYREEDLPNPVNEYGKTKAAAENAVLGCCPAAVVLRISLVLGFPIHTGNSFLVNLQEKFNARKVINCPKDEIRTPIDVHTLCDCLLELAGTPYQGLLHIGCTESIDRYSLTTRLARAMGFSTDTIHAQASDSRNRAPRHKRGILDVSKAQLVLNNKLPDLEKTIQRALSKEL